MSEVVSVAERELSPSGWRWTAIGQLADEVSERAGRQQELPVLSVTKHRGIVRADDYFKNAVHGRDTSKYKVVRRGQFAYATIHLDEGSIGVLSRESAGIVSPMYTVFRTHSGVDAAYVLAVLKLPTTLGVYKRLAEGTVNRRASIGFKSLRTLRLLLPPLGEQRKIAAILSSVDDAIEATQAVIDQLQVVKKAMMAELLTRGLPGRHTRFKKTEIGEVPEEWEVVPLADCLREPIRNGYSPVCPTTPTGRWILHLGAVTFDGFNSAAVKPAPLGDPRIAGALVEPGDVLMSRANTRERVGFAGVYRGVPKRVAYPDLMMRLRVGPRLLAGFLELVLLSERLRAYLSGAARGTSESMVKINRDIVGAVNLQVPTMAEQREIVAVIDAVRGRREAEVTTLNSLRSLKAALMSVLLTGEVRVKPDEEVA